MIIDGDWQLCAMANSTLNWGTAPYPNIFGTKAVWGAEEILTIPKNSNAAKKKAAETFVKWINDNASDWAANGQLPVNKAALEKAKSMVGAQAFIDEMSYTHMLPANPKSVKVFTSAAPSPILTASQDAVLNDKDATSISKQLESDLNAILAKN